MSNQMEAGLEIKLSLTEMGIWGSRFCSYHKATFIKNGYKLAYLQARPIEISYPQSKSLCRQ